MNYLLITGIIVTIIGVLGIGRNQRKNAWIIRLAGVMGYRIFTAAIGIALIVLSLVL